MFDTFENVARRDARRQAREQHLARMEEMAAAHVTLWDDDEPIAPVIGEARQHQSEERVVGSSSYVPGAMDPIFSRRICIAVLCIVTIVAGISSLAIGWGAGARDHTSLPDSPALDSDENRYGSLFNYILDWGVTPRSALEEEGSAQWRALQWLAYTDKETRNIEAIRTRFALATLYFSSHNVETSNGVLLAWHVQTHWLSSYPVCLWHGVECHDEDNTMERVQSLNLTSNGLGGTLPDELAMLELDIYSLDVSNNSIEGTVPESLAQLRNLQGLFLGPNYFKSAIPSALMSLSHLAHFFVNDCALIGTIPSEIGALTQISALGLYSNFLTGTIPSSIESLDKLQALYLDDNLLTGQLPATIGKLTSLVDLRLRKNQFEGTIPNQLNQLSHLEILYLDSNDFTGTLSSSLLGSLLLLRELYLYDNRMQGMIPDEIGSPVLMRSIYLDGNDFDGTLPASLAYLRHLESLYLFENKLSGTISSEFGQLRKLRSLRLNGNELTGSLPPELASLENLETLLLNDNKLTGIVPNLYGDMRSLNKLTLHGNLFNGSVPAGVCSLVAVNLNDLSADCEGNPPRVECGCCTVCYSATMDLPL